MIPAIPVQLDWAEAVCFVMGCWLEVLEVTGDDVRIPVSGIRVDCEVKKEIKN